MAFGKNGYYFGKIGEKEYNTDNRTCTIPSNNGKENESIVIMGNQIGNPKTIVKDTEKNTYIEKLDNGLTVKYTYVSEGKDLKINWDYKKPKVKEKVPEKKAEKADDDKPPTAQTNDSTKGFIQFPNKGIGYTRYLIDPKGDDNWGKPDFVEMLKEIAKKWYEKDKKNHISFGDLSRKNGGKMEDHKSHQNGEDADLSLYYNVVRIEKMTIDSYNKEKCQEFVSFLRKEFPLIKEILFGDVTITGLTATCYTNSKLASQHENHMHIGF